MEPATRRPEVSVIPATMRTVENGGQIKKQNHLRVAAYCRVSTGDESQQTSYTTQKRFYTQMIVSRPGWTLAGIYADEAISGTSRVKRRQFNEMMAAAMGGQMDYIVTKSISRFARNTIDTLECVRQLRQLDPPVGIYFEKENIDTLDATGELVLTILSALAQDESRSISDNIRWAIQRKFQRGEPIVNLKRMMGYDFGENGEWIVNPEQAEIVRYIFNRFTGGLSSSAIARELNEMGKKTIQGCRWRADAVLYILRNEKYVGDCENQKYVTRDFLTHESTRNHGEAIRYYVSDHHEAIIDRTTWDKAQAMLRKAESSTARTSEEQPKSSGVSRAVFANLTCGEIHNGHCCGEKLRRMGYNHTLSNYTDSRSLAAEGKDSADYRERYYYYFPVWRCGQNARGKCHHESGCAAESIYECALEQSLMELLYRLKRDLADNGEASWLMQQFRAICAAQKQATIQHQFSEERLQLVEMQLQALQAEWNQHMQENSMDEAADEKMQERMKSLERERNAMVQLQDKNEIYCKNFDFFVRCLQALPETNSAGQRLNINGLDNCAALSGSDEKNAATAPDYLHFEKGIYMAFFKSGIIKGDTVEYQTNFGITMFTTGNRRTLDSFLGFRRANPDQSVTLLDERWKVNGRNVCYTRTAKKDG